MTERTAGSLNRTDAYMGRTVTVTGRVTSLLGIGDRVRITVEVAGDEVVDVHPKA